MEKTNLDTEKDSLPLHNTIKNSNFNSNGVVNNNIDKNISTNNNDNNNNVVSSTNAMDSIPAFVFVFIWISFSSSVILFNKYILASTEFSYPILLTTWHMTFSSIATQILARFTPYLDSRLKVGMNISIYVKLILPIGVLFTFSLIFNNKAYLYLSVAFIQMLKATTPVALLIVSYIVGAEIFNIKTFLNVCIIVIGVIIASYGEINFNIIGVIFQVAGILAEASRLVLVGKLLNRPNLKMSPLVSLYYFAPICALFLAISFFINEYQSFDIGAVYSTGVFILISNALVAFGLNCAVVFLIGKTSSLVMTLCGILKDILLVAASMIIWGTIVTKTQFFGYSIALIGLIYYKLGYKQVNDLLISIKSNLLFRRSKITLFFIFSTLFISILFITQNQGYYSLQKFSNNDLNTRSDHPLLNQIFQNDAKQPIFIKTPDFAKSLKLDNSELNSNNQFLDTENIQLDEIDKDITIKSNYDFINHNINTDKEENEKENTIEQNNKQANENKKLDFEKVSSKIDSNNLYIVYPADIRRPRVNSFLDIVLALEPGTSPALAQVIIDRLMNILKVSTRYPRIFVYITPNENIENYLTLTMISNHFIDSGANAIGKLIVIPSSSDPLKDNFLIPIPEDIYLRHIISYWDNTADHTMFIPVSSTSSLTWISMVESRIKNLFQDKTGVLHLGSKIRKCRNLAEIEYTYDPNPSRSINKLSNLINNNDLLDYSNELDTSDTISFFSNDIVPSLRMSELNRKVSQIYDSQVFNDIQNQNQIKKSSSKSISNRKNCEENVCFDPIMGSPLLWSKQIFSFTNFNDKPPNDLIISHGSAFIISNKRLLDVSLENFKKLRRALYNSLYSKSDFNFLKKCSYFDGDGGGYRFQNGRFFCDLAPSDDNSKKQESGNIFSKNKIHSGFSDIFKNIIKSESNKLALNFTEFSELIDSNGVLPGFQQSLAHSWLAIFGCSDDILPQLCPDGDDGEPLENPYIHNRKKNSKAVELLTELKNFIKENEERFPWLGFKTLHKTFKSSSSFASELFFDEKIKLKNEKNIKNIYNNVELDVNDKFNVYDNIYEIYETYNTYNENELDEDDEVDEDYDTQEEEEDKGDEYLEQYRTKNIDNLIDRGAGRKSLYNELLSKYKESLRSRNEDELRYDLSLRYSRCQCLDK